MLSCGLRSASCDANAAGVQAPLKALVVQPKKYAALLLASPAVPPRVALDERTTTCLDNVDEDMSETLKSLCCMPVLALSVQVTVATGSMAEPLETDAVTDEQLLARVTQDEGQDIEGVEAVVLAPAESAIDDRGDDFCRHPFMINCGAKGKCP